MSEGWAESELHKVLTEGYSRAGIHNLNPSPGLYNAAGLLSVKDKLTPYVLDPSLEEFESMYAFGHGEALGFYPNRELITKRQKALEELSGQEDITATKNWKEQGGQRDRIGIRLPARQPAIPMKGKASSRPAKREAG